MATRQFSKDPSMVYMEEIGVRKWPQILINVCCFVALGVSLVILFHYDHYAVHKEGFFCDDQSIAYPKKSETINNVHLVVGAVAFSFLAIIMCEMIAFFQLWRRRRVHSQNVEADAAGQSGTDKEEKEFPEPWKVLFTRISMQLLLLIYGFMLVVFVTEVIKVNMGRLRPNFLAVCQLVPGSYNCSQGFVTDFQCGQTNKGLVVDARKSFLSGHASVSFFHMIFIIFYIQPRLPVRYWSILKPLIQTLAFLLATYVSITRITDYKHHCSDVIFGALLGTLAGLAMAFKMGQIVPFRKQPFPKSAFHHYYTYWHDKADGTESL